MLREKQLMEKRAAAWAACTEIMERARTEDRVMTTEERTSYERGSTEVEAFTAEIQAEQRHQSLESSFGTIDAQAQERARFEARSTEGVLSPEGVSNSPEYRDAFSTYLRGGRVSMENAALLERAQVVGTNNVGGFLVPTTLSDKISETMRMYGSLLGVIDLFETAAGETYKIPTNDDIAEGTIVGETPAVGDHDGVITAGVSEDVVFGQASLGAFWYSSRRVLMSYGFIQDTAYDAEGFVARKVGERLGRAIGRHSTVGTGVGQPQGVITGAGPGVTASAPGTVTWRDLTKLEHSVDAAYRMNAMFAMNDNTVANLKLEVDTTNRPLWQPSTTVGAPDRIAGYGYLVNNYMASAAASAKSVAFGDFKEAVMGRMVKGSLLMVLNEKYAEQFQKGYLGYRRYDQRTIQPSAVKVLVH